MHTRSASRNIQCSLIANRYCGKSLTKQQHNEAISSLCDTGLGDAYVLLYSVTRAAVSAIAVLRVVSGKGYYYRIGL